jgi:uncharacterized membrane protein YccC
VALCALFIQQPFFLLPLMWGYIILIMYFMGSSRYRSTLFMAGYPFIVITYMSFFDKGHAEHIAIIVYQSVITGLACASLVMVFLWPPVPIEALREKLIGGLKRPLELQRRLLQVAEDGVPLDLSQHVPEYYRAKTPELVALLDQAQTDLSFDDDVRHDLMSLIAFDSRCAACLGMVVDAVAADVSNATPRAAEALRALGERMECMIERLEHPKREIQSLPPLPPHDDVPEWLMPLCSVAHEAERVAPAVAAFAVVEDKPDFGTETLRNLRDCIPNLFRQPVLKPNVAQLKHSVKAASAIMICALFCIALNWTTGIGCVETVMLVVQATFGGTLLIGSLRMVGVVIAYALSIFAVIWIVPVITTIPGLLAMFGVVWGGADTGPVTWIAFFITNTVVSLAQPAVGMAFPSHLAGRALSAYNLVVFAGVFVIQWGMGLWIDALLAAGWSITAAYQGALGFFMLCSLGGYGYFWWARGDNQQPSA